MMKDRKKTRDLRYVRNTDGCDVQFNENNEELIPVHILLSKHEMLELMHGLSFLMNSVPSSISKNNFKKIRDLIFSQL
jgi:hypothetical protein